MSAINKDQIAFFFDQMAPRWDALEKSTYADLEAFLSKIDIKTGDKVLDIGCGTGIITPILAEKSKSGVLAIDLSAKMIEEAKNKYQDRPDLHFEKADFYELEEAGFDWIICFNAYPHFMDKQSFIRKLDSSLNKGGHFAICHNISRRQLDSHHQGDEVSPISRYLSPVFEEIADFKPYFDILEAKDDSSSYWIIGRKK